MHLAADYGQLEVLEYLAAQGADINAKDKHGISVILAAIWEGHSKCVKFLLDKVSIDNYTVHCNKISGHLIELACILGLLIRISCWNFNDKLNPTVTSLIKGI